MRLGAYGSMCFVATEADGFDEVGRDVGGECFYMAIDECDVEGATGRWVGEAIERVIGIELPVVGFGPGDGVLGTNFDDAGGFGGAVGNLNEPVPVSPSKTVPGPVTAK